MLRVKTYLYPVPALDAGLQNSWSYIKSRILSASLRSRIKCGNIARLVCLFFCLFEQVIAQSVSYTEEDRAIFNRYRIAMEEKKDLPADRLLIETALFFLETPYVASTLEMEPERLVINLREMDCSTFIENVISLARTIKSDDPSWDTFCRNLQELRYREGTISDYTDRLHYTSDWIFENERKGMVKDITGEIGGKPLLLDLSFMSTHPDSYRQLKNNPDRVKEIAVKEAEINKRSYYYIPKDEIEDHASGIKDGDIIGFVTSIKGLDLSHVGIAVWKNGKLTFIHASSSSAMKVIIQPDSLIEYTQRMKSNKGIMVVRNLPI